MPQPVIERALRLLPHVDFVNAYGLTETSSTIAVLTRRRPSRRDQLRRSDTCAAGWARSAGRCRRWSSRSAGRRAKLLAAGQSGEVYVRGEQVSGEYLHKKVLQDDGWFATNDAGWMDEDGYLFVEGRLDDVIVRGGENISPGEIEDVLREHPQVADVRRARRARRRVGRDGRRAWSSREGRPAAAPTSWPRWVKARLRSTKTPGGLGVPRRAALQRHRQAAAPPAEGRDDRAPPAAAA